MEFSGVLVVFKYYQNFRQNQVDVTEGRKNGFQHFPPFCVPFFDCDSAVQHFHFERDCFETFSASTQKKVLFCARTPRWATVLFSYCISLLVAMRIFLLFFVLFYRSTIFWSICD